MSKLDDPKTRSIWGAVQWAKAEVASWHPSKRGEDGPATKRDAAHDELARVVEAEDIDHAGLRKLALAALGDMPAHDWQDSELWRNLAHTPELDYEVSCYLAAVHPSRTLALLELVSRVIAERDSFEALANEALECARPMAGILDNVRKTLETPAGDCVLEQAQHLVDDLAMTRRDYCRERAANSKVHESASDVAREMGWDDLDWGKHGE